MNRKPTTRVLVAGATGYLGGFVARELKARGHFVRALARTPEKLADAGGLLDEIVQAEVTRPESLAHVCDGIDVVFSSVGITRQRDGLTFHDVDYQGNRNLLDEALRAGVGRFVYVSVLDGPDLLHLDIIRAHEDFVAALRSSGMDHAVLRPTGFFSDMSEYFRMALKGRVFLVGSGENHINPIHGADLAETCADAVEGLGADEIDVGGPDVLTHRAIAELALETAGKARRISSLPVWMLRVAVALTRLVSRRRAGLLAFFTEAMTRETVGPVSGRRHLAGYFAELMEGQRP